MKERITLGIETSCDETAASIYSSTRGVLSNKLFSQVQLHSHYGGVVPEIASRSHIEKISVITSEALKAANTTLEEVDAIAVTNRPGLPGSLLVGVCFAKAIAWAQKKRIIGINHLEGHAFSAFLEHNDIPFPFLCLTASGGHTSLYLIKGFGSYEIIGQTTDDAAGEAFDKIAKLLHLPYPGGPIIEKFARDKNFKDFYNYPRGKQKTLNFSFSGLKTAVLYDLVKRGYYSIETKSFSNTMSEEVTKEVASSLLVAINDIFEEKIKLALHEHPEVKALTFVGGVACNKFIKENLSILAQKNKIKFYSPSPQYCTDNAAMIAFVGNYKAEQNKFDDYDLDIF